MQIVTEDISEHHSERSRFVRVQDAVGLHVRRLVELPAAGYEEVTSAPDQARHVDKYSIEGYADVTRDFPAVAQHIRELEERIRELLMDVDVAPSKPTHKVSLSAGGVSFSNNTLFVPGEIISITLTLFPTGTHINTDAIVTGAHVSDEVVSQDNLTYHTEFVRISDGDRCVIETHVDQLLTKRPDPD